jgi:hypothetical protein
MINQLGWDNLNLSCLPTHRNLTLEFLSSLRYAPDYRYSIHKGLARFRLFGVPYRYSHRDIAEFMNVPNSPDDVTKVQEDEFMDYELRNFWGSISGDPNSDPEDRFSTQIHNPAISYFHMILAHTIFGKPVNDTGATKEELFILFCVSQGRPVNLATFMLANFVKVVENTNRRICIGVWRPMTLASKVTKPPMQIRRFVFSTILTKLANMNVAFTGHSWEAQNNMSSSSLVTAVSFTGFPKMV